MSLAAYTTYPLEALEGCIDLLEEEAFQAEIIGSFESRGWALYEFGLGESLSSYLDLQHIVAMGRAKDRLKHDIKYLVLPLNEQDVNWPVVRDLMFMILSQGRGPYFVDLDKHEEEEEDDIWVEPVGVYLVDSVILEPPFLRLIIDPNMSRIKDPRRTDGLRNCEIPIHVSCVHIMRDQMMQALRVI